MSIKEIELNGRKYKAHVAPDEQDGAFIIIGPPDGLVDAMGLPEPFATRLHNALYERGILSAQDAVRKQKDLTGALQETLLVDAQRLMEIFFQSDRETV